MNDHFWLRLCASWVPASSQDAWWAQRSFTAYIHRFRRFHWSSSELLQHYVSSDLRPSIRIFSWRERASSRTDSIPTYFHWGMPASLDFVSVLLLCNWSSFWLITWSECSQWLKSHYSANLVQSWQFFSQDFSQRVKERDAAMQSKWFSRFSEWYWSSMARSCLTIN